jgi:hypothetical protein
MKETLAKVVKIRYSSILIHAKFSSLKGVMLVKFTKDTMIHPKETSWFQSWNEDGDLV